MSALAIFGIACGPVALILLILGCCASGADADALIERSRRPAPDGKGSPWLADDATFDFQISRKQPGGVDAPRAMTTADRRP